MSVKTEIQAKYLSPVQAAKLMGIGRATFYDWVKDGTIPAHCIIHFPNKRRVLVIREKLETHLESLAGNSIERQADELAEGIYNGRAKPSAVSGRRQGGNNV